MEQNSKVSQYNYIVIESGLTGGFIILRSSEEKTSS